MKALTHSASSGKWLCLEFTNTVENYRLTDPYDELTDIGSWLAWSGRHGVLTASRVDELASWAEANSLLVETLFDQARELRVRLFRLLSACAAGALPTSEQLEFLNQHVASSLGHLKVSVGGERLEWQWDHDPAPQRLLWPIVRSAAELLTSRELARLRQCSGDKCTWLFIDQSKNRSRRWCDMKICGNRAKSRKHYRKIRGLAP